MTLNSAKIRVPLMIQHIEGPESTLRRLQELGILLQTQVTVVRKSPFSGPLILQVGTAFIALRSEDARGISVEELV